MITFYYSLAPNPMKVALCLEEMGLPYKPKPVDTRRGDQHAPDFLGLNPNGKVPVIVDQETGARVFDSNAILLYLAEKTGRFLPKNTMPARGDFLSWLMFVASGVGPYSGQAVHFRHFAPDPKDYAVSRYLFEAKRHLSILDEHLRGSRYMLGGNYTVLDMSVWGWARLAPFVLGSNATDETIWTTMPNLRRLVEEIGARPAAQAALALKDSHAFKTEMDEDARRHMFRHLAQPA